MEKIYIVGNPNTGKTTLFNSLTKSSEHTGNWHGVTVNAKSKIVRLKNQDYEIVDLPGLYSLNTFSFEEKVSLDNIENAKKIIYIVDAFNFKRNMFLALQLLSKNKNVKICINNYHNFKKAGGRLDEKKLSLILGCSCEITDASKQKPSQEFFNFQTNFKLKVENKVEAIYQQIEQICSEIYFIDDTKTFGISKLDSKILKFPIFLPLFLISIFLILYLTFFLLGPILSDSFSFLVNNIVGVPISNFLSKFVNIVWINKFFEEGILSAGLTLCSFLPQVSLLYIFLSILEDSGIISRMAFMFDDFLSKLGLNGKAVYTMLMGFGCNTSACFTSKNMADKNMRIKTALITPFMSCTAKLPVYSVVASALFGIKSIFVIFALYLLGVIVAVLLALIYEKTILKSKSDNFLIEFPSLQPPKLKNVLKTSLTASKQFISKVFGVVLAMSVIIWLITNIGFDFKLTSNIEQSILYQISLKISWLFTPIGLNSPAIVSCLIVGLIAKELIVSAFIMFNKATSTASLIASLTMLGSCIHFTNASALSFLVFVLLYSPCISTIAVQFKELGKKYAILGLIVQNLTAYILAMLTFVLFSGDIIPFLIIFLVFLAIFFAFYFMFIKFKKKDVCSSCLNCRKNCH